MTADRSDRLIYEADTEKPSCVLFDRDFHLCVG